MSDQRPFPAFSLFLSPSFLLCIQKLLMISIRVLRPPPAGTLPTRPTPSFLSKSGVIFFSLFRPVGTSFPNYPVGIWSAPPPPLLFNRRLPLSSTEPPLPHAILNLFKFALPGKQPPSSTTGFGTPILSPHDAVPEVFSSFRSLFSLPVQP